MQCPNCFAEIPNDVLFCDKCGEKIDFNAVAGNEATDSYMVPAGFSTGAEENPEPLDLMGAVKRPFQDPEAFKKITLGGLIALIPFVGVMMQAGFVCEYIQRIIRRENSNRLPEWGDLIGLLTIGIWPILASMLYGMVVMIPSMMIMVVSMGGVGAIMSTLKGAEDNPAAGAAACSALAIPMIIVFALVFAFSLIAPFIEVFYAKRREFGDCFDVMGMLRLIMTDVGGYLMIILALFVIGFGVMIVMSPLSVIPILGPLLMNVIMIFVSFGLRAVGISAIAEFYYKNHEKAGV